MLLVRCTDAQLLTIRYLIHLFEDSNLCVRASHLAYLRSALTSSLRPPPPQTIPSPFLSNQHVQPHCIFPLDVFPSPIISPVLSHLRPFSSAIPPTIHSCALHAKRVTIMQRDMQLVRRIRGDFM